MSITSPHYCHQASLEGAMNSLALTPPLSLEQRQDLTRVFTTVIDACEPLQNPKPYKPITLVRLTYECARSEASRDNFLRFFFQQTKISSDGSPSGSIPTSEYVPRLMAFAQTLFDNFFLPLKAAARKTPQPSPAALSDDESKQLALAILNMFDDGVVHLIESIDIDRPRNAITLTHDLHHFFGRFEAYFEPTGNEPHTYRVDSTRTGILRHRVFPVDRTLFLTDTRTIDPPSPRLLAIHSAIAHILHRSAAGRYIDSILEDLDQGEISVDGSTPLGHFTALRIHGWWDGRIRAY
ncbi:hypothetical protein ABEF92_001317 [Exophiala dermatitidis]|uniref:HNH nuclease domain-containing protein n=1 Tax=Exophiala dermatitidis (strain ATCC 34100 / CBS 525.76 / NIH/UT8656) TaxID=858893 RepID=H6CBM0_EXODN|nr:uncharacterized protein HMPREF1120_09103 [Exophiala dermatitidis NIH/UT8656]EHY61167.1 hypothetical protein HMPREF1120_09103 [Exophiala dermatitidis NIH/UT8656]